MTYVFPSYSLPTPVHPPGSIASLGEEAAAIHGPTDINAISAARINVTLYPNAVAKTNTPITRNRKTAPMKPATKTHHFSSAGISLH